MRSPSTLLSLRSRRLGFTLIELMMAVVIVSVLLAIAMPSYRSQVIKSHRIDARNALLDLAAREERFFAMNNRFSGNANDLGYSALPLDVVSGGTAFYQMSVTVPADGQSYTGVATPTNGQTDDSDCYTFQLVQNGTRSNFDASNTALDSNACWK